jgi:hypothetical protein
VDAYLTIAEHVLRDARRPLGAREIIRRAYAQGHVAQHLYGATQHKTLGARLSEDILQRGEKSHFFRSSPGKFFLSEFLGDPSLPVEYRTRFHARRRKRQLVQLRPLALEWKDVAALEKRDGCLARGDVLNLLGKGMYHYAASTKNFTQNEGLVWTFVVVVRGKYALTYRHGHYREHRDAFTERRAIGFFSPVTESDRTLLDIEDHGVVWSGLRTVSMDLGLSRVELHASDSLASLEAFVSVSDDAASVILGVVKFQAPDWFEPYARRLAINDLEWLDLTVPTNHLGDFDPWSQAVLASGILDHPIAD